MGDASRRAAARSGGQGPPGMRFRSVTGKHTLTSPPLPPRIQKRCPVSHTACSAARPQCCTFTSPPLHGALPHPPTHLHVALQPAHCKHGAAQGGAGAVGPRIPHVGDRTPRVGLQREQRGAGQSVEMRGGNMFGKQAAAGLHRRRRSHTRRGAGVQHTCGQKRGAAAGTLRANAAPLPRCSSRQSFAQQRAAHASRPSPDMLLPRSPPRSPSARRARSWAWPARRQTLQSRTACRPPPTQRARRAVTPCCRAAPPTWRWLRWGAGRWVDNGMRKGLGRVGWFGAQARLARQARQARQACSPAQGSLSRGLTCLCEGPASQHTGGRSCHQSRPQRKERPRGRRPPAQSASSAAAGRAASGWTGGRTCSAAGSRGQPGRQGMT